MRTLQKDSKTNINSVMETLTDSFSCRGNPYEYMDSWERFNETSLLAKKDFYCNLKAHRQISNKWCFEKYCSCDQTYQFSAL